MARPPKQTLTQDDLVLLDLFHARSQDLRAVAVTLARLGVRWRQAQGARTAAWLKQLETHPFYKAGQVLFDLLEWEDFMLDGPGELANPQAIAALLNRFSAQLGITIPALPLPADLPALEPGFYLYRDVVLGILWTALAAQAGFSGVQAPLG